jgi:hypothetical protein
MRSRTLPTRRTITERLAPLASCTSLAELTPALVRATRFASGCDGIIDALNGAYPALEPVSFLRSTLPFIVSEAAAIGERFSGELPLLAEPGVVCLTRSQTCSILACMFFGLLPAPKSTDGRPPHDWPDSSMEFFFGQGGLPSTHAKLRCILQYFTTMRERTAASELHGHVYFRRVVLEAAPDFGVCAAPMLSLIPHATGVIDDAVGALHVDFANEYLGGGVLFAGAVQVILGKGLVAC